MIGNLIHIDQSVFLFLNSLHNSFFDQVMFWGTQTMIWLPLFIFLLYITIRVYKWKSAALILSLVLTITISDQCANLAKSSVKRLRPSNDPALSAQVHIVNGYRGGKYGFYSSHASNTMATAIFLILLLKSRNRWLALLLLPWAVFMAYTRLYLGVHYPADLLAGMIAGGILGWAGAQLCGYLLSFQTGRSTNTEPLN